MKSFPIESLLSARWLLSPQLVDDYVYFLSNMSGSINLYRMKKEGGMPDPLLPSGIALQNPHLMLGESFVVFPELDKILVMIDNNGDENYQPCTVPLDGGITESVFADKYDGHQLGLINYDRKGGIVYFTHDDRKTPNRECIKLDLKTREETSLGTSIYGNFCAGTSEDHSQVVLIDQYTAADSALYLWNKDSKKRELLFGTSIEKRESGKYYPPSGITRVNFAEDGGSILFFTNIFDDKGSLGQLKFKDPSNVEKVRVSGTKHTGLGELEDVHEVEERRGRYLLKYNIDGCTWIYEGHFKNGRARKRFVVDLTLVGKDPVSQGVVLGIEPVLQSKRKKSSNGSRGFVFSFTGAVSPSQLYVSNLSKGKNRYTLLSSERVLGIPEELLSRGEDASYDSFDGLRMSARLYLPSSALGYKEPYPLVLYVHGGPQGQERPDFTWFSMPLIQYLTLNGIAVFVPNVRGSTGYGLKFMKMVDHDWGGKDRLDLVEGLKFLEEKDGRIDSIRRGVIGRSYGGYMTLTLASRHPDLWKAAVDMFGPYNMFTFLERLPETWRTYFYLAVGHPERDKEFLTERSPSTYIDDVKCPMLMIQGKNDPRVVEGETRDVVERLRARGVPVEYLVFEDEGHDVIKFKNKVTCYNQITSFFGKHLGTN